MIETINPTTGTVIERIPRMDEGQIEAKLAAAARGAARWATTTLQERSALLDAVARRLRTDCDALAATALGPALVVVSAPMGIVFA